jgi:hypothetical protein
MRILSRVYTIEENGHGSKTVKPGLALRIARDAGVSI